MTYRLVAAAAAVLLCLGGCSTASGGYAASRSPAPVASVATAPMPTAVTQVPAAQVPAIFLQPWDGSYEGRETLVHGAAPVCPTSGPGVIEIGDGTLVYPYSPFVIFTAVVQPDGSLHAIDGTSTLAGTIAHQQLLMRITSPGCASEFSAHYVWNHSYPPPRNNWR